LKKEYDEYLCSTYPKLYKNRNLTPQQSCFSVGFEIGNGWYNIIKGLSLCIQGTIDANTKERWRIRKEKRLWEKMPHDDQAKNHWLNRVMPEKIPQVTVDQVKEKFGTLRFYYSGGNDAIEHFVSYADVMSSLTCERCGGVAETDYSKNWVSTICPGCKDKRQEDYNS
jgi:hypothetical protein